MDSAWRVENCHPSAPDSEDADYVSVPPEEQNALLGRGQRLSQSIESSPYDPVLWFDRGNTLLALGFVELAIADLYKADLLCEYGLEAYTLPQTPSTPRYGHDVLHTLGVRFFGPNVILDADTLLPLCEFLGHSHFGILQSLVVALSQARCFQDAIMIADKALMLCPDDATRSEFHNLRTSCKDLLDDWMAQHENLDGEAFAIASKSGCVYRRVYPWMNESHLRRSSRIIETLQAELRAATGSKTCILRTTTSVPSGPTDDYSVFAGRVIRQGELLFVDGSTISTLADPFRGNNLCDYCFTPISSPSAAITVSCCNTLFCSKSCRHLSLSTYHPLLCKVDLSFLHLENKPSDSRILNPTLLLPRLIASYLASSPAQQQQRHPLSHPLLSRWKPDFRSSSPPRFPISFKPHIQQPIQILQALGINIFADTRFDAWVMQNLLNRVASNAYLRHPKSSPAPPAQAPSSSSSSLPAPPPPPAPSDNGGEDDDENDESRVPAPAVEALFPETVHHLGYLLPLFNHACDPNLAVGEGPGGVWVRARRDIGEGEELCVSYVADAGRGLDREASRRLLGVWFNECACRGCVDERAKGMET